MHILIELIKNISVIALAALLLGQIDFFRSFFYEKNSFARIAVLSALFGFMSVIGTVDGVPVNGALANTRIVGAVVGGVAGGPVVGVISGLIGGIHRYSLGGFTAAACGVSTVFCGLFGGLFGLKFGMSRINWRHILMLGAGAEIIQKTLVLALAKPFEAALDLELKIALPTTAATVVGIAIFMRIFIQIKMMQDQSGAAAANLALDIASRTLPQLRTGLNEKSAEHTAETIYKMTAVDAIAITDFTKVLSYKGIGEHLPEGKAISLEAIKTVLKEKRVKIAARRSDVKELSAPSPLKTGVGVPLYHKNEPVGTLQFYFANSSKLTQTNLKLIDGLAKLLSVQIELAEAENQYRMRQQAELKALQAQINPHFLFNTLSTIMSYCRINPDLARSLLGSLSDLLRRSLNNKSHYHSLKEELDGVVSYLEIEKVRFANRLHISMNIDPAVLNVPVPILTLQPLVENAVRHGLFPKTNDCRLVIGASKIRNQVRIVVEDNGVGIQEQRLSDILSERTKGIGLSNVHNRLRSIYGKEYGVRVKSAPGRGTTITVDIPGHAHFLKESDGACL
ncbi:LytS/YhcK type 5TM receptor domain-containing protein [Paenibacillus hamazuiensis]|uniref:LytS/YhcK type 5TM receptor domain-containing protein n=1 Tax=Paenibacillus hamazuiensis TaxID=2936508 RepID=UPI00200FF38D|nr:LytS/YhcK type 5TM receptor domain-containing protein [Paenibacillus hamazuiensis]